MEYTAIDFIAQVTNILPGCDIPDYDQLTVQHYTDIITKFIDILSPSNDLTNLCYKILDSALDGCWSKLMTSCRFKCNCTSGERKFMEIVFCRFASTVTVRLSQNTTQLGETPDRAQSREFRKIYASLQKLPSTTKLRFS